MKTRHMVLVILFIAVFLIIGWSSASANSSNSQIQSTILYVKPGGISATCSSWDEPCELQQALTNATADTQIWVAAGTYKPTTGTDRTATFQLKSGVAIYGGFPVAGGSWEQRDWETNLTILSGDLAGDDLSQEGVTLDAAQIVGQNARHVVSAVGLTAATALEGVIISGGDARGAPVARGGGLYAVNSSLMLREVALLGNAAGSGGGISVSGGQPLLEGVLLEGNLASGAGGGILALEGSVVELVGARLRQNRAADGGALASYASRPRIVNGALAGNQAARGGALYAYGGELQLLQATLAGNAGSTGSAAYLGGNASLGIGNSILWGNTPEEDPPLYIHSGTASVACTLLSGGYAGEGNLDADPLFVDLPGGELQLRPESPAVDAGDNGALPAGLEQDLAGGQRVRDGDFDGLARVDMGAYEYQALVPPVAGFDAEPLEGMVPLTAQLQDTSRGEITSWLWDLGDGSSSVERSPQHSYGEAGSYTVTLTVSGPGGTDSLQRAGLIQVRPGSIAGQVRAWGSQAPLAFRASIRRNARGSSSAASATSTSRSCTGNRLPWRRRLASRMSVMLESAMRRLPYSSVGVILMETSFGSARPASTSIALMMPEGTGHAGCDKHFGASS